MTTARRYRASVATPSDAAPTLINGKFTRLGHEARHGAYRRVVKDLTIGWLLEGAAADRARLAAAEQPATGHGNERHCDNDEEQVGHRNAGQR
jgi:hypothetical protein